MGSINTDRCNEAKLEIRALILDKAVDKNERALKVITVLLKLCKEHGPEYVIATYLLLPEHEMTAYHRTFKGIVSWDYDYIRDFFRNANVECPYPPREIRRLARSIVEVPTNEALRQPLEEVAEILDNEEE
jgi:hypothetical protein